MNYSESVIPKPEIYEKLYLETVNDFISRFGNAEYQKRLVLKEQQQILAQNNDINAILWLAKDYMFFDDHVKAIKYYELAVDYGYIEAKESLNFYWYQPERESLVAHYKPFAESGDYESMIYLYSYHIYREKHEIYEQWKQFKIKSCKYPERQRFLIKDNIKNAALNLVHFYYDTQQFELAEKYKIFCEKK
jgi:TPR repeat protein